MPDPVENRLSNPRSEERDFDSSNGLLHENCSGVNGGRTNTHHSSSNRSAAFASSDNGATSSYNSGDFAGNHDDPDSSLGKWGFACKRKAVEVISGGSSSSNPRAESVPSHYNASSSFSVFLPSDSEQGNSRNGIGKRLSSAGDEFPPSSVNGNAESSTRNLDAMEENIGNQGSVSFGFPPALWPSDVSTTNVPPRPFSVTNSSDLRHPLSLTMNSTNQSPSMASTGPQRSGNSSNSSTHSAVQDETSFRSSFRSNRARSRYVSPPETRNSEEDSDDWNSARMGPSSSQQTFPSTGDINWNPTTQRSSDFAPWTHSPPAAFDPGSPSVHFPLPSWTTTSSDDQSPLSWASASTEEPVTSSRPRRRGNRQPYLRSTMTVEVPDDNHSPWRAFASDFEGRHRVASEIRQMLNAMQRSENLQAEDYTMFNPFTNGVAETHDRHRDMRLDVDNMSYEFHGSPGVTETNIKHQCWRPMFFCFDCAWNAVELAEGTNLSSKPFVEHEKELLALEERIGNVNTGLSEATILGSMKQRKHESICGGSSSDLEPCCICREEYAIADDIGTLGCGHEFHTHCIKKWLMLKNLCPICKTTGLET